MIRFQAQFILIQTLNSFMLVHRLQWPREDLETINGTRNMHANFAKRKSLKWARTYKEFINENQKWFMFSRLKKEQMKEGKHGADFTYLAGTSVDRFVSYVFALLYARSTGCRSLWYFGCLVFSILTPPRIHMPIEFYLSCNVGQALQQLLLILQCLRCSTSIDT